MRTSAPIGVKPQERKARSERALPGATWAQHHSPAGTHRSPAAIRRPPGTRRRRRRVEQLDGQLASPDQPAADRRQHRPVRRRRPRRVDGPTPAAPWGARRRRRRDERPGAAAPPTPRATRTTSTVPMWRSPSSLPASQRSTSGCSAPPKPPVPGSGNACVELGRRDVGEDEGVAGEGHDGPRPVGVRWQDFDVAVGSREAARPRPRRGSPPAGGSRSRHQRTIRSRSGARRHCRIVDPMTAVEPNTASSTGRATTTARTRAAGT